VSVALPARAPARNRRSAEPEAPRAVPRTRRRTRPRRITLGGAAWVVLLAVLLGGIVALNVEALRDSIQVNKLQARAQQLANENRLARNRVTSLASPVAIGIAAQKLGMHPADPTAADYLTLPTAPKAAARP
jgi:hypothetical protein